MIIAEELFDRIVALIQLDEHRAPEVTGMLYDTLKLACREALSNNRELFGNLFFAGRLSFSQIFHALTRTW